jgi:hypothetical protein
MPQGSTMQRKEKEKIVFVWKIKKNKEIFFSWKKVNDEPSHHQMHLVNRKDIRGLWKTKTFENVWRSFSCINNEDEERFYRKFNKKRL